MTDREAAERLAVAFGRIRLVTSNAFDSVGASAAGLRTAWVNRSAAPFDTIGPQPDLTVPPSTACRRRCDSRERATQRQRARDRR